MEKPQYIDWIVEETGIVIKDDIPLKCYKIDYKDDESILDDWALHIRRNYIEDTELKEDADDNAMTVEQYLHDYVIPQKGEELGATVRSADITEILISDLLEFVHQYSVPRYKLKNRSGKNNSQQGTDVIAYKYKNEDKTPNDNGGVAIYLGQQRSMKTVFERIINLDKRNYLYKYIGVCYGNRKRERITD